MTAYLERLIAESVRIGEPFRIGSKLSQSGKHKKPRRESRLFSFKSRVFWGFLLTAGPELFVSSCQVSVQDRSFPDPHPIQDSEISRTLSVNGGRRVNRIGALESTAGG
jgi:hypothetical protein